MKEKCPICNKKVTFKYSDGTKECPKCSTVFFIIKI